MLGVPGDPVTDLLLALLKGITAGIEAAQQHMAEREAARVQVAAQAAGDLAAVDGRPPTSNDNDLP